MNRKEFEDVIQHRLQRIKDVMIDKNKEYSSDDNVFYNFERSGEINRCSRREALWDMASKHLVSIIDMVEGGQDYDPEYVEEKIGDLINYLILLEGMLYEGS